MDEHRCVAPHSRKLVGGARPVLTDHSVAGAGAVEDAGGGADVHQHVRTLACPAMRDTSVASSFQVKSAVVQKTCRKLSHVQGALPSR